MNLMARLLYLTLPIKIPLGLPRDLRSRFVGFIWAGKPARVCRDILTPPKERGVGFPDHETLHLKKVLDWCASSKDKPWIHMGQAKSEIPLEGVVWLTDSTILQAMKRHPTVGTTLRSVKKIFKKIYIYRFGLVR